MLSFSRGFNLASTFRTCAVVLVGVSILFSQGRPTSAQSLTVGLFERYLEPLRVQAGIPGISALIVQGGQVWARGFGMADLERGVRAEATTPYPIADLTQVFGATLVLQRAERGGFQLSDPIDRWTNLIARPGVTLSQVLTHTSTGAFHYNPAEFAALTPVIEHQAGYPFRRVLADEIFDRLAMFDSVPGHDLETPSAIDLPFFDQAHLARYAGVIERLAAPYSVDARRPVRSEYPPRAITAASGLITTVLDLARFDAALDDGALVGPLRPLMWTPAPSFNPAVRMPAAHGWFVQGYNGQLVMWQFGVAHGAFSSLMLKVPGRDLTLVLLANSDGLSAPFALEQGDVTTSLFARVFLRVFIG